MKKNNKKKIIILIITGLFVTNVITIFYNIKLKQKADKLESKVGVSIEIKDDSKSNASNSNWNLEKVNKVYDTEGIPVPVPKGYVASAVEEEHTVNTGFVIYEGEDIVNDSNKEDAQKNRNQYVWVPIEDLDEFYGRDSNGVAHGKLYNYNNNTKVPCNWSCNSKGEMEINSYDFHEPLNELDSSSIPSYLSMEGTMVNKEFESMICSVELYGGFFMGRYEVGNASGKLKVVKMNTDISSQSWNVFREKCRELKHSNENIVTTMIYSCMFDATLNWLVSSGCKSFYDIASNSQSWGNYGDNAVTYVNLNGETVTASGSVRIPTGSSEQTKTNNIYDLTGNVYDLSLELYGFNKCVIRGGRFNYSSRNEQAYYRYGIGFNELGDVCGCRAALYIAID